MTKQDITYQDKLNELRLDISHPNTNSNRVCFVLLEGETDVRLFRKLFNLQNCKVETIPGGNPKLLDAVALLVNDYELVVGIRDSDFLRLEPNLFSANNIFLTDFHDIEMSLIADDETLSAVIFEFFDTNNQNYNTIRQEVISAIEQISLLKWLNFKENLELKFEGLGFQDLISFANTTFDFDNYFNILLARSQNAIVTDINAIKSKLAQKKSQNAHHYQLCNGHDFFRAFSKYVREKGNSNNVTDDTLSRIFRINYSKEKFYTTQLYAATKVWADSKNCNIY